VTAPTDTYALSLHDALPIWIMMKYNMNLTFPIADWFMGTTDLRRGLLGHLFNGYSEKHVKEELKPVIAKFRKGEQHVTLDGPERSEEHTSELQSRENLVCRL